MIEILIVVFIVIYCCSIGFLVYGCFFITYFRATDVFSFTKFSIIVPFRNENDTLPRLMQGLSKLKYPTHLFEVVLVDDASTFAFEPEIYDFKTTVIDTIRVSNSPKKDAIETAIIHATSDWIITTDADCLVEPNWLKTLDAFIQVASPEMIVGAVRYLPEHGLLHHFQQLDMASLQGATMGSYGIGQGFMCNGANFAYTKKLFFDLNGFDGNNQIASGDDVFLLQKAVAKYPEKVKYLKTTDNIVTTKSETTWKRLFNQRVRWASKTNGYQSIFGKMLAYVVFFGNLCWILTLLFWLLAIIDFKILVGVLISKFVVDYALLLKTQQFLKFKMKYVFLSSILYPIFCISVALYSVFGKYEWKSRRF